jgi:redox-sensitive bicupin YhaK (pirin superfamily)
VIVFDATGTSGFRLVARIPISLGSTTSRVHLRTPDGRDLTAFVAAGAIHALYEQRTMTGKSERLEVLTNYERHLYATAPDSSETVVLLTQAERDRLEAGELELPSA